VGVGWVKFDPFDPSGQAVMELGWLVSEEICLQSPSYLAGEDSDTPSVLLELEKTADFTVCGLSCAEKNVVLMDW
jgi:hypothetical protein